MNAAGQPTGSLFKLPAACRHEGELLIERTPTTMAVRDVGLHLRCSVCGRKGPETEPVWSRRDQAWRLPGMEDFIWSKPHGQ